MSKSILSCGFCPRTIVDDQGLSEEQQTMFAEDPKTGVIICEHCIEDLHKSVQKNRRSAKFAKTKNNPTPKAIFDYLERHVIGQQSAKKALSIAVAHHFRRINSNEILNKSNVLIAGPSGSGKTEMARTIAKYLNVPFAQVDITQCTPRGYVGESIDVAIERLYHDAGGDLEATERGIIFIDEIDKLPNNGEPTQFKSKSIQQELLKMVEGDVIELKKADGSKLRIDTSKVLFIAAGAFVDLPGLVSPKKDKTIGFVELETNTDNAPKEDWQNLVESKHLIEFGFLPEFIGRFPVFAATKELSKEDLIRIMIEPENSIIDQYGKILAMDKIKLEFDPSFFEKIADDALKDKVGARGLRKHIENSLKDLFFRVDEYSGLKVVVTASGFMAEADEPFSFEQMTT